MRILANNSAKRPPQNFCRCLQKQKNAQHPLWQILRNVPAEILDFMRIFVVDWGREELLRGSDLEFLYGKPGIASQRLINRRKPLNDQKWLWELKKQLHSNKKFLNPCGFFGGATDGPKGPLSFRSNPCRQINLNLREFRHFLPLNWEKEADSDYVFNLASLQVANLVLIVCFLVWPTRLPHISCRHA